MEDADHHQILKMTKEELKTSPEMLRLLCPLTEVRFCLVLSQSDHF